MDAPVVIDSEAVASGLRPERPRQSFQKKYESLIWGGGAVLLTLAVWQACWSAGWISPLFFTGPSAVAKRFYDDLLHGRLLADMGYSGLNFLDRKSVV